MDRNHLKFHIIVHVVVDYFSSLTGSPMVVGASRLLTRVGLPYVPRALGSTTH